jgi:pimeloyl-ACP methyl ester carboxylesterase
MLLVPINDRAIASWILLAATAVACKSAAMAVDTPAASAPVTSTTPCDFDGVRSIDVEAIASTPDALRLQYRYRVFESARPNATTVIVVPGGPGTSIMGMTPDDAFAIGAIPSDQFRIIYTDARGSGCNTYPLEAVQPGMYRSEELARDILAVVQHEQLSDYLLYGASFGTVTTTIATALAPQLSIAPPQRLVLEGAVGTRLPRSPRTSRRSRASGNASSRSSILPGRRRSTPSPGRQPCTGRETSGGRSSQRN